MSQGRATDDVTKARIKKLLLAGLSHRAIARMCYVARSTIGIVVKEISENSQK